MPAISPKSLHITLNALWRRRHRPRQRALQNILDPVENRRYFDTLVGIFSSFLIFLLLSENVRSMQWRNSTSNLPSRRAICFKVWEKQTRGWQLCLRMNPPVKTNSISGVRMMKRHDCFCYGHDPCIDAACTVTQLNSINTIKVTPSLVLIAKRVIISPLLFLHSTLPLPWPYLSSPSVGSITAKVEWWRRMKKVITFCRSLASSLSL